MTDDRATPSPSAAFAIFATRLAIALFQALALYLLLDLNEAPRGWLASNPAIFKPLLLCAVFLPVMTCLDAGRVSAAALAIWIAAAALATAGVGFHAATRDAIPPNSLSSDRLFLPFSFWLLLATALFIAQVLVVDGVREGKWFPSYRSHFDTAWRQGAQLALGALFVGIFWGVLLLGSSLFKLIQLDFFEKLIAHRWFSIPATTLALAGAIHVTDVQPQIIRGARGLALALLSWLLPLLSFIIGGFLLCLPFLTLKPLWATHFAASLLLTAAALLIFLINCCYQDGSAEGSGSRVKRFAASLGAVELAPLIGLAAWALTLRVREYGWSVERIEAAAVIAIGAIYAAGYAYALVASPVWLKRLETTNIAAAYGVLAVFLALFTPIADPARLMVEDQVARLQSGAVASDKFDFVALKFDGARWGAEALKKFSEGRDGANSEAIRAAATSALARESRFGNVAAALPTDEELAKRIKVQPAGRTLPSEFLAAVVNASKTMGLSCGNRADRRCVAQFFTIEPGSPEAILLIDGGATKIFEPDEKRQWRQTAVLSGPRYCNDVSTALQNGDLEFAPHLAPDIVAGGQRLVISPIDQGCPKKPAP